jgi:hypothetical protein
LTHVTASEHRIAGKVKAECRVARPRGPRHRRRPIDAGAAAHQRPGPALLGAGVLADAGIDCLILDQHTSLVEGSIGAIPRRLMVAAPDHDRARALLAAAERELR